MRTRSDRRKLLALAGGLAAWYCAAALTETAGAQDMTQLSRCAELTGLARSECERRDTANTENLPAGVTPGRMLRLAERAAELEAARDTRTRSAPADTMRAPPASPPAATTTPPATAPAPSSTPRADADTLNRPRG